MTTTYCVGNLCPGFGQAQQCGLAKPVNGISPLDNWISNNNTDENKQ